MSVNSRRMSNESFISRAMEVYNDLWAQRDKRVDSWFLMSSIWPIVILVVSYLYLIKIFGPNYMLHRNPIELKSLMAMYNAIQVVGSLYMFVNFLRGGWFGTYSWICQAVDNNPDPNSQAIIMASTAHLCFLTKLLDFVDTFFFVIRKKDRQITLLHVFHHSMMPIYGWIIVRWLPGGHETFGGMINSLVHFIMYFYYFLSGLGPKMQPYLWWKKYLTMVQMIQFTIVLVKSGLVVFGIVECGYPKYLSIYSCILMVLFCLMFFQFYKQEYRKKKKE